MATRIATTVPSKTINPKAAAISERLWVFTLVAPSMLLPLKAVPNYAPN